MKRISKQHPTYAGHRGMSESERWNLSDLLLHSIDDYDLQIKELDSLVSRFESWRSKLTPDIDATTFVQALRNSEEIAQLSAKLSAFAYLWFSENTKNPQARAFKSSVEERLTALQNRMLFFDLWWQGLDSSRAEELKAESGDFAYHLDTIRRFKRHTLSEPEEKIINLKNVTGRQTINTIYDVLTNGLSFTITDQGKKRKLTREQLSSYVRSPRPRLREAAYRELNGVFADHHDVVGEIYAAVVNDWKAENLELRKFESPIAARNLSNDVPDEAVGALLSVCNKNTSVFQDYFRLKARICGINPINRYHIYAPHPTRTQEVPISGRRQHGAQCLSSFLPSHGRPCRKTIRRTSH